MRTVVYNGKGGVGKSTFAANLATLSNVELFDADPQATCCYWKDRRVLVSPDVIDVSLGRVAMRLKANQSVVVDLPGAAVSGIQESLKAAQVIVIPITYDQACLDAIPATLELVKSVNVAHILLINRLHPKASVEAVIESLKETLESMNLQTPICPYPLRDRVVHRDLWAKGEVASDFPNSEAGTEVKNIWKWLESYHG
jgi:chromosome partitioning protein